jgi:hypothetical protein
VNQTAYALHLFIRDVAGGGDLAGGRKSHPGARHEDPGASERTRMDPTVVALVLIAVPLARADRVVMAQRPKGEGPCGCKSQRCWS